MNSDTLPISPKIAQIVERLQNITVAVIRKNSHYYEFSETLKQATSIESLQALVNHMLNKNLYPNSVILNQLIDALRKLNEIRGALDVYKISFDRKLSDCNTHRAALNALARTEQPDLDYANQLLNNGKNAHRQSDDLAALYTSYFGVVANAQCDTLHLPHVLTYLEEAEKAPLITPYMYGSTLKGLLNCDDPDATTAVSLLTKAHHRDLAYESMYTNALDCVAKSSQRSAALMLPAFEMAKHARYLNHMTFRMAMFVLAHEKNLDFAKAAKLLKEAEFMKCADGMTYALAINMHAQMTKPDEESAWDIYIRAQEANQLKHFEIFDGMLHVIKHSARPNLGRARMVLDKAEQLKFANDTMRQDVADITDRVKKLHAWSLLNRGRTYLDAAKAAAVEAHTLSCNSIINH